MRNKMKNEIEIKMEEKNEDKIKEKNEKRMQLKKNLRLVFLAALIALIFIAILLLKKDTFNSSLLIYFWSIFITVFMATRVTGSFFYKSYTDKMDARYKQKLAEGYEPTISFVIPCKNEEKVIYNTIKKCLESDYPKNKIQITVINDGSTDNTLKEMRRYKKENPKDNLKILNFKENRGKREAMYEGFKASKGEIIIQVDSDSYPAKDAIRKIIAPFADEKVGGSVGHTDPINPDVNLLTRIQKAYYAVAFRAMKATESVFDMVFCCSGCFSAYRKSYVMPQLDEWVNEKFLGKKIIFGDDRALTNLVLKQGYKTVYIDDAQAYTIVPEKFKSFLKQQIRWKKGWFINSVRIIPNTIKRDKFIAFTYLIPQTIIALATPFIAFKSLVLNPVLFGVSPIAYVLGIYLVSAMLYLHYKIYCSEEEKKYGKYILVWSTLNLTLLSYIIIYALYDLKNMSWGTR